MFTTADAVRQARERRGWSQGQLADRSGVDRSTLSRIENGVTPNPGKETLRKVADALGVPFESLAGGQPAPPSIPIAGRITRTEDLDLPVYRSHAGRLIIADPTPIDHWRIRADRTYTVEVIGNCLFGKDINEGDLLLVDRERTPGNDDVVVVRIGDETYLSRWQRKDSSVVLEMSDGQFREAMVHDVDVQGVVMNVIKPKP